MRELLKQIQLNRSVKPASVINFAAGVTLVFFKAFFRFFFMVLLFIFYFSYFILFLGRGLIVNSIFFFFYPFHSTVSFSLVS